MGRFNRSNLLRGISYFRRNGLKASFYNAVERLQRDKNEETFEKAILADEELEKIIDIQRQERFDREYKISILIPAYETDPDLFMQTLESIAGQSYGNWELCIADASKTDGLRQVVRQFCEKWNLKCSDRFGKLHDKVNYKFLGCNKGISGNTNEALAMAKGDYIALLDHDDLVDERALYEFMKATSKSSTKILLAYTDEDKISEDGSRHFDFHIKPDFDPVLLCTNNYICHFAIIDTTHARGVGGFYSEYDGAQDHDFFCRCTENVARESIYHIPEILYHWRSTALSTAENPNAKLYAYEAGQRAVADHLKRMGIKARVSNTPHLGFFAMEYENINMPVLMLDEKEFAQYTEESIRLVQESFIMILSSELKSRNSDFQRIMLSCMNFDDAGAVTGKIIGKNGRIESAGYDKIKNSACWPRFEGMNPNFSGYLHRANIAQSVDGFSAECVLLRKAAVKSFYPRIELKENYFTYYEPKVVFKRKLI